jgi:mycofactocin precursor
MTPPVATEPVLDRVDETDSESEDVITELVVEEISIDGMCGVY